MDYTCKNCGNVFGDHLTVCPACGAPVDTVSDQTTAAEAAPNYQPQPEVQQQPYQQQAYQQQPYQQQPYQQQAYQQPYQQQVYQQPYQQTNVQPAGSGKATASLVLGIVSIVLCSLLFGIIGVVLGVQARNMMPEGTPGRGKATAGLVCSIIGCVWGSLILVCYVCAAMADSYYTALLGLL